MNILKGFLILTLCAFPQISNARQDTMNTTRAQRADSTYKTLFQSERAASPTDPELLEMLQRNIFGEAFHIGDLSMRERELITVAALTTLQTLPQLKAHVTGALKAGNDKETLLAAMLQTVYYIGLPNALTTIEQIKKADAARFTPVYE